VARSVQLFAKHSVADLLRPNYWDAITFVLVIGVISLLAWGASQMTAPYHLGEVIPISLGVKHLPYYALRTVLRMLIGLTLSFLFTFTIATWAAKNRTAERFIIPFIDIMQSVPVLGFLSITVVGFIALFPHSILGPECACIFAIFTAQVWNMALSFYQSLKTIPQDLDEAAEMLHLSPWQKFWRLEVPFAMPGLLWNAMMSMSASWFFVVASEAISVSNQNIHLPGIGSYVYVAIKDKNIDAIFYAIAAMVIVIFLYDQLLFRPLVKWAEKFKMEHVGDEKTSRSIILSLFLRTRWFKAFAEWIGNSLNAIVNISWFNRKAKRPRHAADTQAHRLFSLLINTFMWIAVALTTIILLRYIFAHITLHECTHVLWLGLITGMKVLILIIISAIIWIPIGVWVGLRPGIAQVVQPIIQFVAAIPAHLFFPAGGDRHYYLPPQRQCLDRAVDDPRHAVVHPLQCHRRRQCTA